MFSFYWTEDNKLVLTLSLSLSIEGRFLRIIYYTDIKIKNLDHVSLSSELYLILKLFGNMNIWWPFIGFNFQ